MASTQVLSTPPALATLIRGGRLALFLDFDGTLVELAQGPDAIAPVEGLADRLDLLSQRLDGRLALVSGRAIEDIERHLGPLSISVAGSHGADVRSAEGEILGEAATSLPPQIEAALRSFASEHSVDYEHKAHGGALHYRSNLDKGERAIAFANGLANEHGLKAQGGKCVIEIVAGTSDKGQAVRTFMQSADFAGAHAFFIGDDLTDEAGFAACQEMGGAGILVGSREGTAAHYCLPNVSSVHDWLEI